MNERSDQGADRFDPTGRSDRSVTLNALEVTEVSKTFGVGPTAVTALDRVSMGAAAGTMTAVVGRSGSGKTTLLNVIGGLEDPTAGEVVVGGVAVSSMSDGERSEMRRSEVAFIFQAFGLLPVLTAAENVEIPMRLAKTAPDERRERAQELLASVGLAHRAQHRPAELSGGEQQRVAIARALANRPDLLLADEPTGQLDSRTGGEITRLLADVVHREGIAAVVVTHEAAPLAVADEVYELHDGSLHSAG